MNQIRNVFLKYVRSKVKSNTGMSPLQMSDGRMAVSKANTLNNLFSSVLPCEDDTDLTFPPWTDVASKSKGNVYRNGCQSNS